ncbi:alpha/beta fold hydrolase [Flavobacterium agrisoli]|uniref:Alpha/beta hydrolase n=1 Tax=Flavobacterium agrisoli TaxID=2793066 RepID=A0A934PL60_9FLAO|nr:alpha/beta hydrolase [Flavobacterium agrisoli]MBK0368383.1 alpha/beta hydrolase [Flavobacterium agrisoli]
MNKTISQRNNVNIIGNGNQTILFAHGFGCDQNMWRFVTPSFIDDYRIVLFDYVGCGQSDINQYNPARYSNLNGYAQDIINICDELDLNDVIFVGHSVSSMIGSLVSIKFPDLFSAMVFIGPSACYINDTQYFGGFGKKELLELLDVMDNNYLGWANFLAPIIMKNEDKPELVKELEESFCATDPIITRQFAETTFFSDNRKDLSRIKIPVLILQCSDDAIAPDAVGEYIAQQIQDSSYVKLDATGHCPHMSHPEETILAITNFLNKQYQTV